MKKPDGWLRFEAKVKSSKVYIACWSRPAGNAPIRTRLSYGVIVFCLIVGIQIALALSVKYNTLDEMEEKLVTIIGSYCDCGRRGDGAILVFSEEGVKKELQVSAPYKKISKKIKNNIGNQVMIWIDYRDWVVGSYYLIRQIHIEGKALLSYRYPSVEDVRQANVEQNKMYANITKFCFGFSFFLILYVILRLGINKRN